LQGPLQVPAFRGSATLYSTSWRRGLTGSQLVLKLAGSPEL
jgi:hypothetical protein